MIQPMREKQAKILRAEADKESRILAAEAEKAALIAEAEGKATAVDLINKANPNQAYLTIEGYRALIELSKGDATKIIIPSELQNITATLAAIKEGVVTETKKK